MSDPLDNIPTLTGFIPTPKPSLLAKAAEAVGLKRSADDIRKDVLASATKLLRKKLQEYGQPIALIAHQANMDAGPFHRLDIGRPVTHDELVAMSPWIIPGMKLDPASLILVPDFKSGNVNVARPGPNAPVATPAKKRIADLPIPARSVMPVPANPLPDKAEAAALINLLQNVADEDVIPVRGIRDGLRQALDLNYTHPAHAGDRLMTLTVFLFNEQIIFNDNDPTRSSAAGEHVRVKADGVERLRRFC